MSNTSISSQVRRNLSQLSQTLQGQPSPRYRGVYVRVPCRTHPEDLCLELLGQLGLSALYLHIHANSGRDAQSHYIHLRLDETCARQWAPGFDTLQLQSALAQVLPQVSLVSETLVALLLGPMPYEFPSLDELISALRIRMHIVQAAQSTSLAFHTKKAERPEAFWTYKKGIGFVIRNGVSLVEALTQATQPSVSGSTYAFSCYRATEYVCLLGIAQELEHCNPEMYQKLQHLWSHRPIMSGEFHDVFLRELGSIERPLPPKYFVPGDRVWFRNPHEPSADVEGFEGSWLMYLGNGLFNNFWDRSKPYNFTNKCVEIFHWRHGICQDRHGEARMDEQKIKPLIQASLNHPEELQHIMNIMARFREPRGVYTDAGGCIDTSREFSRWVRPGTADLMLPKA